MNSDIITLRQKTGAGVMECKRALEEAGGNFEKALSIIRERGILRAESKKERKPGAGLVDAYVHNDRLGVLLEIRAETDFVVRSEPFRTLAHEISMQIAAMAPEDVASLLAQPYIKNESVTIEELVKEVIAKVGENIEVERFTRYEA